MICVRYSDTQRKYNDYPVPATSVHQSSKSQRDGHAVQSVSKNACSGRNMDAPDKQDEMRRDSRKIIVVFENDSRVFAHEHRYASYLAPVYFLTPLISAIVRTF